jgi:3-dehydroquinate synthase
MNGYKQININTSQPYLVHIGKNILYENILQEECTRFIKKGWDKLIIIADYNLPVKYHRELQDFLKVSLQDKSPNFKIELLSFKITEQQKNRDTKEQLENKLFELNCGKKTLILAIGGGVLLDIVGFVAATYNRGIPVIYIPTTLLAMVDASVGGKTGINTPYGKNLIGVIKQPAAVLIDVNTLESLPAPDYLSAMAEIIKIAVILDEELCNLLSHHKDTILLRDSEFLIKIIYASVQLKKQVIEQDEFENGMRELLNFGHTIGHVVEKLEGYLITHGFAVALGMWIESNLAWQMGCLNKENLNKIQDLLSLYFYNKIKISKIDDLTFNQILLFDKKVKESKVHYVLVKELGKFYSKDNKYSFPIIPQIEQDIVNLFENNPLIFCADQAMDSSYV